MEKAPRWTDILFDLDGTLTDPGEGITGSVRFAMETMGYPVPTREVLERFVGPPLDEMFSEICQFGPEETERAILAFRRYFSETGIHQNNLFPGMDTLLARLCDAGCRLYIATTKPVFFANKVLASFGLARYFTYVAGSGLEHAGRPKAEVVAEVLAHCEINTQTAVMVGDRMYDVNGAHENGLPCIGVLFGYGSREELTRAGADALATDVDELESLLLP